MRNSKSKPSLILILIAAGAIGLFNVRTSLPAEAQVFAYVTNGALDRASVIDTATNMEVATVILPFRGNAAGVAITPDGTRAYVTNEGSDTVSVIDTATNTVIGNPIPVGASPIEVAITPDGTRAYVVNFGPSRRSLGTVSVIDTATNTVVDTVTADVGINPRGVAITPDGTRAYVTNDFNAPLRVIDTDPGPIGNPNPNFNTVIDTTDFVGIDATRIAITPDGSRAYVTIRHDSCECVQVIDTATNRLIDTDLNTPSVVDPILVGTNPRGIAITPDGTRAYVANRVSGDVSVIDTDPNSWDFNTVIATVTVDGNPFGWPSPRP